MGEIIVAAGGAVEMVKCVKRCLLWCLVYSKDCIR